MENSLTLVIPTHNRHQYLSRSLEYYKNCGLPIIVSDSSIEAYSGLDKYEGVEYLHFPGSSYSHKLPATLSKVKTPYVVMCADDDFIVLETLKKCFEFLESHPDYSVAMGSVIYFSIVNKERFGVEYAPVYKGAIEYNIEDDSAFDRVKHFFRDYRTVYYGLHRTEIIRTAFENTESTRNLLLYEYISGLYPLVSGKVKAFPDLYQVREYLGIPQQGIANIDKIFTDGEMRNEYEELLDQQTESIAAKTAFSKPDIKKHLNQALEKYAKHYQLPFHLYIKSRLKVWAVWFLMADKYRFFPLGTLKSVVNRFRTRNMLAANANRQHLSVVEQFLSDYYNRLKRL